MRKSFVIGFKFTEHSSLTDESPKAKNLRKLKEASKKLGHGIFTTDTFDMLWKKSTSCKTPCIATFRAGVIAACARAARMKGAKRAQAKMV
jgi:hypothetical protein